MENRGVLGIDESNHGNFPEIYVAVFSFNWNYVKQAQNPLPRIKIESIDHFLPDDCEFKHIIFSDQFSEFHVDALKTIAISEFISYFMIKHKRMRRIINDGDMKRSIRKKIDSNLSCFKVPKIISRKNADKIYPVVYMADRIANYLFRHYSEDGLIKPYLNNLITPKFEDYQSLLKTT